MNEKQPIYNLWQGMNIVYMFIGVYVVEIYSPIMYTIIVCLVGSYVVA